METSFIIQYLNDYQSIFTKWNSNTYYLLSVKSLYSGKVFLKAVFVSQLCSNVFLKQYKPVYLSFWVEVIPTHIPL